MLEKMIRFEAAAVQARGNKVDFKSGGFSDHDFHNRELLMDGFVNLGAAT